MREVTVLRSSEKYSALNLPAGRSAPPCVRLVAPARLGSKALNKDGAKIAQGHPLLLVPSAPTTLRTAQPLVLAQKVEF